MNNVLILGANGGIARYSIDLFLEQTDAQLTLFLRNARRLKQLEQNRARVVEGDVLDTARLKQAMAGQDVVYANLAGDLERMAKSVVTAMDETGVRRLIWISSMGIYDEVPGQRYRSVLDPYRDSQVKGHIRGNVNVGNGRDVLLDVITQLLPWVGYPRTLNALTCLNEIAPERP
jgi:nucleoside-diphosphate-sugar epimerase